MANRRPAPYRCTPLLAAKEIFEKLPCCESRIRDAARCGRASIEIMVTVARTGVIYENSLAAFEERTVFEVDESRLGEARGSGTR